MVRIPDTTSSGQKHPNRFRQVPLSPVEVTLGANGWELVFDYEFANQAADSWGAKPNWSIDRSLVYVIPEGAVTRDESTLQASTDGNTASADNGDSGENAS
jgi:hypothetical protein